MDNRANIKAGFWKWSVSLWTRCSWFRMRSSSGLLWTQKWVCGFYEGLAVPWAERLFYEGLAVPWAKLSDWELCVSASQNCGSRKKSRLFAHDRQGTMWRRDLRSLASPVCDVGSSSSNRRVQRLCHPFIWTSSSQAWSGQSTYQCVWGWEDRHCSQIKYTTGNTGGRRLTIGQCCFEADRAAHYPFWGIIN